MRHINGGAAAAPQARPRAPARTTVARHGLRCLAGDLPWEALLAPAVANPLSTCRDQPLRRVCGLGALLGHARRRIFGAPPIEPAWGRLVMTGGQGPDAWPNLMTPPVSQASARRATRGPSSYRRQHSGRRNSIW